MDWPRIGLAVFAALVLFRFVFGSRRTFATPKSGRVSGWVGTVPIAIVLSLLGVPIAPMHPIPVVAGALGLLGSLALYEWARSSIRGQRFVYALSGETPTEVWTVGPFAYIRHPFYASYILSFVSTAVMFPNPLSALVAIGAVVVFRAIAVREEALFAAGPLATEYARYARRTGRLFPKFRS